jgi:hypothetical protein
MGNEIRQVLVCDGKLSISCVMLNIVFGPLFVLGTILFPPHQASHHTLLDHSHCGSLSSLSRLGIPYAHLPPNSSSLG